jgi:hypothetical protein
VRALVVLFVVAACSDDAATTPGDSGPCIDATHDEDGDGIGDGCDICPAAADPLQRDTTELATMITFSDGVGDACDPRPSLSGDVLAALHTFADPAAIVAWNGSGWTIANDRATAIGAARWVHRQREGGDGLFVQAKLATFGGDFEMLVDGNGVDTGLACALASDRDGDGNEELDAREVGGATATKSATKPITGAITISAWRVIDVQRRGELRCRVKWTGTSADTAGQADLEIPTTDGLAIGIYGFAQASSTTEVDSLVVYTSPTLPERDL